MNLQDELTAMHKRMFTDELSNSLLGSYRQEMELMRFTVVEDDYARAKSALENSLTDGQKSTLADIEASWQKTLKRAVGFGFSRGLYAGFSKALVPDVPEDLFQSLVADELLTMPSMRRHPEYSGERDKALLLYNYLYAQANDITREHLTSIESAWDERLYGVLRHAFDMGLRQAVSLVDEVRYKKAGKIIPIGT